MKKLLSLFLVFALFSTLNPSLAQAASKKSNVDAVTKVVESISSPEVNFTDISAELTKAETLLKSSKVTAPEISKTVRFLGDTRSKIDEGKKQIDKELSFVQKRIVALGETPKDGGSEIEIIAQKRKEFNDELAFQKSKRAEADILLAKIDELDTVVINVRSQKLLGNLMERQLPLINPANFLSSTQLFVEFGIDIIKSPIVWFDELNSEGKDFVKSNLIKVTILFLLSLWLGIYLRLFIMRHFGYRNDVEHLRFSRKVSAAIFVAIGYGVIPAFILGSFMIWMISTKFMTVGFFGLALNAFIYFALYVILARAVARVIFAPYNEKWRLVNVSTDKAKSVTQALYYSIMLIGLVSYLQFLAQKANYALELISYLTAISSAIKAFCIVWIIKRLLWEPEFDAPENQPAKDDDDDDEDDEDSSINTAFKITFFTSVFAISVFALSLFGYPYLSAFIFNHIMISILIIGIFFIIRKSIIELLHRLLLLKFWVKTFRLRRRIMRKFNFWSGLIIDPFLIILMVLILLGIWGVSTDILIQTTIKLLTGFTVGGVEISIFGITMGIAIFFVAVAIIRSLKRRLMNNVLQKMDIDDGLKHSLASGFGFFGFILAALLSFAVMGGNLTNFALIAGALSLGIGLGLQNIVNNFVSGIILLFERPIKVGDWVIVNGQEGVVKQINIRSTELETWKRASIIIPNADLLSNTVTNLTHDDKWGRLDIDVGVAYGSDVHKVKDVLLEIAEHNKRVLKKPGSYVIFKNFGPSSLDFELRCYTSDIMNGLGISSDIRYEINRRFAEEGINISFPQQVLHLGDHELNAMLKATLNNNLNKK